MGVKKNILKKKKFQCDYFFSFQIYVPLTLIVCCSWVTFWLMKTDRGTEIPARTSLGATTVLSVVTIGFGGKSKPQVTKKYLSTSFFLSHSLFFFFGY